MVAPGRVELPTFGLGNRCSIHLSYGAKSAPLSHDDFWTQRWSGGFGSGLGGQIVQCEIQFQHVDSRFSKQA